MVARGKNICWKHNGEVKIVLLEKASSPESVPQRRNFQEYEESVSLSEEDFFFLLRFFFLDVGLPQVFVVQRE